MDGQSRFTIHALGTYVVPKPKHRQRAKNCVTQVHWKQYKNSMSPHVGTEAEESCDVCDVFLDALGFAAVRLLILRFSKFLAFWRKEFSMECKAPDT